jgi:hypothetical protein
MYSMQVSIIRRCPTHQNSNNAMLIRAATSTIGDSALAMAICRMQLRPHRAIRQLVSGLR